MLKLQGKIKRVFETQTFGNFEKRVFWLDDVNEQYPNTWEFELWKKDVTMIDAYNEGDFVTVYFDVKGKVYSKNGQDFCMNTLKCWNFEKEGKLFKPIN